MKVSPYLISLLIIWPLLSRTQQVDQLELCESVDDREPMNVKTMFAVGERVYCWLNLSAGVPGQRITVQWEWKGDIQHQEQLSIYHETWRTYCYKTLYQAGNWRVVVRNAQGDSLSSKSFIAGESTEDLTNAPGPPTSTPGIPQPAQLTISSDYPRSVTEQSELQLAPDYDPSRPPPLVVLLPSLTRNTSELMTAMYAETGDPTPTAFWQHLFPNQEVPMFATPSVMLMPAQPDTGVMDWEGFAAALYRYENRLFADLAYWQEIYPHDTVRTILVGTGIGADLAWAIIQRYPDRFTGGLLLDCRCSYYQRGSLNLQAGLGVRYVLAHGPFQEIEAADMLRQSIKRLTQAQVPFQYWELAQPASKELEPQGLRQSFRYLLSTEPQR